MFVVSLMFTCSLPLLLSQKVERLVYNNLSAELVFQAREFGQAGKKTGYFLECQLYLTYFIIQINYLESSKLLDLNILDFQLLLTMGLQPFVSKFFTMPLTDINSGIQQLCTRFEMQLQCQLGFGESRY
uniref:Secreted protein n=1 Tax=Heterorhabditis bacteriophora TaxID=37862 RepID=A0A1I7WP82_HETBA